MGRTGQFFAFALLAACAEPALADSCVDPYARTVSSPDLRYTLKFVPRKRDCKLEYCDDSPRSTGELAGNPVAPTLSLSAKSMVGKQRQLWSIKLTDWRDGPSGLVVADTGHVLIADQWCDSGLGLTLAVYGPDGAIRKSWALTELLPETYVAALVQTSFNIHWRNAITYDAKAKAFAIPVAYPDGARPGENRRVVQFLLDPERLAFAPRDQVAWEEALAHAERDVRNRCATRKWQLARAAIPLSAPVGTDRFTWMNFAMELERRIVFPKVAMSWEQRLFLPAQNDPNYEADLKEFRRVLTMTREQRITQDFYLVSPDLRNAHAILKTFLAGERYKNLGNDRFVIVGAEPTASDVAATIADYGGHQWRIVGPREALPPAADRKDYDWPRQRACAAIGEGKP